MSLNNGQHQIMYQRCDHSWDYDYRIFFEGFSRITHPLTYFQKEGLNFYWTYESKEFFQHLKNLLTSVTILNIIGRNVDLIVCIDTYKEDLEGILTKIEHVISYESTKLKEHERHYATHHMEFTSIVRDLNILRHYTMRKYLN